MEPGGSIPNLQGPSNNPISHISYQFCPPIYASLYFGFQEKFETGLGTQDL